MFFPEPERPGYSWICFRALRIHDFPDVNEYDDDRWFNQHAVAYSAHMIQADNEGPYGNWILWFMLVDDLDIAAYMITNKLFSSRKLRAVADAYEINPTRHDTVFFELHHAK